jgi:hypothetical protein
VRCLLKRALQITSTVILLGVLQIANADVVTDWNTIAVSTVSADTLSNRQNRAMAMVHAAMFDAMNAIRPYYTPAMVSIRQRATLRARRPPPRRLTTCSSRCSRPSKPTSTRSLPRRWRRSPG